MSMVFDHYPRGGGELLTALALADHADHQGLNVRPGIAGLARKTRQSERTVQNHLARMRRDQWLLPVRYMRGGFGRVTEYRVNPAWLNNPADFAPLGSDRLPPTTVQVQTIRVQTATAKGEDGDQLGCNDAAPQPSGIIIEPTTTGAPGDQGVVVGQMSTELEFPPGLQGEWLESARRVLRDCPEDDRTAVLDEVAGIISQRRLRGNPIGLLHRLVERSKAGKFVPSRGIPVAQHRRRQRESVAHALKGAPSAAEFGPRAASELAAQALEKMRAALHSQPPKPQGR
jgi:hypothetical protein